MASVPSVAEFYSGRGVFITGVTGFLGKVLLEKLLRSCPDIRIFYVLIRPKRGKCVSERLEELVNSKLFDKVNELYPDCSSKVIAVQGDILEDNLGLCPEDEQKICEDVSIVFHSAATVKFDEQMKLSIQMNVVGVKFLLELCHKINKLDALIHVSTAYANCDRMDIDECIYEPPLHPQKLIDAVQWMDTSALDVLTKKMVGRRPNTYTYTKAMAEYLLLEERRSLPVAIVRPSIVGATFKEPIVGWVDNFNGPTGMFAAIGKGILRTMIGDRNSLADIIPCDITTNLMVAVAWHVGTTKPNKLVVFNNTTGQINGISWGEMEILTLDNFMRYPFDVIARVPNPSFTEIKIWRDINIVFDHLLPAYLMDFYLAIVGKKRIFVRIQEKLWKGVHALEFFTTNQWKFSNKNIFMLLDQLSNEDREMFDFDVRNINWPDYIHQYCMGTKRHLLNDDLDNIAKARRSLLKMQRIQLAMNAVLVVVVWRILVTKVGVARSMWNLLMNWVVWFYSRIPRLVRS